MIAMAMVVPRSGSASTSAQVTGATTPDRVQQLPDGLRRAAPRRPAPGRRRGRPRAWRTPTAGSSAGRCRSSGGSRRRCTPMPGISTATSSSRCANSMISGDQGRQRRYGHARGDAPSRSARTSRRCPAGTAPRWSSAPGDDGDAARRAVDHDQAERDQPEREQEQQVVLDRERVAARALAQLARGHDLGRRRQIESARYPGGRVGDRGSRLGAIGGLPGKLGKLVAALLVVAELVEAGARRREQHRVAGPGVGRGCARRRARASRRTWCGTGRVERRRRSPRPPRRSGTSAPPARWPPPRPAARTSRP